MHYEMNFVCADVGYAAPSPIEPRDEVADLMHAFNASVEMQAHLTSRIEKAVARMGGV